jgi:hypothetical protein
MTRLFHGSGVAITLWASLGEFHEACFLDQGDFEKRQSAFGLLCLRGLSDLVREGLVAQSLQ